MHASNPSAAPTAPISQVIKPNGLAKELKVIKRTGQTTPFDLNKIKTAITKAFLAVEGEYASGSQVLNKLVEQLTQTVMNALLKHTSPANALHIENIQDQVELALMRGGHHQVARAYVLYRTQREGERKPSEKDSSTKRIQIITSSGRKTEVSDAQISARIDQACANLSDVDSAPIHTQVMKNVFDGMTVDDLDSTLLLAARGLIDQEPNYGRVAARLLLGSLTRDVLQKVAPPQSSSESNNDHYISYFPQYIRQAAGAELLDEELTHFDLPQLAHAIKPGRDLSFDYLGLQTLYDRYFVRQNGAHIELPQAFFMRVAMGLAINEVERESKAIEFYELLSQFDFMCSTPTLFNSGTRRPQLSSCYLTTVPDDLSGIYDAFRDNALLSKFAGGLGNDWTPVRGMGAAIKGTNGESQGVVPFLKVANDTAVAVNQGGKRKGAVCAYLETWHIDIEDFLDLRKNTGDERRRTHDMNTANWIPDLFMQRVVEEQDWTLFSPNDVPDLHDLYGPDFKTAYEHYEAKADAGEITHFQRIKAVDLWRKMISMLFETGHPWITFKDPCNIRYTNQHQGTVHSSNLCTEITLHTSQHEIAVCNLGSVNLAQHMTSGKIDHDKLKRTVCTAMRMLDNVIEYNYYSVPQARSSNLKHRPVGLGLMGFQDALYQQELAYDSEQAVEFADRSMEAISYYAIQASCDLARERGQYQSYQGSLWSQGILPIDSINLLSEQRGSYLDQDTTISMDWDTLRSQIQQHGMRNSNCLAIAPTATISNICGVSQSIEPTYQNLFVKSNLSGEFTVINRYLVQHLKQHHLWDQALVNDLKYQDGSVQAIDRIPDTIKTLYKNAFEIDTRWLVEAGSRRQKWLDQSQSLNLYMAEASGKKLDQIYKLAWVRGLKTTYYLRSLAATQMEKNTDLHMSVQSNTEAPSACSILDPDCEACQ